MTGLRFYRLDRGRTQTQLSDAARIDQRFISAIERGEAYPTPDQLRRLAAVLDVPDPQLLLQDVTGPAAALEFAR